MGSLFADLGEAIVWPVLFPRPGTRATKVWPTGLEYTVRL